jgi:hypothetical protein
VKFTDGPFIVWMLFSGIPVLLIGPVHFYHGVSLSERWGGKGKSAVRRDVHHLVVGYWRQSLIS